MKTIHRFLTIFILTALFALSFATPVLAFDGRGGDTVTIEADEVVSDDLYVSAETFTLEGTVEGDLIVFATTVYVNGTVEGDLMAAGNTIVIEGTVNDDVRVAAAAIQVGEQAKIAGDVIAASASLETKSGSTIGGDVIYAGAQALLAGSVQYDVTVAVSGLEVRGEIGGDLKAEVADAQEGAPSPSMYINEVKVAIPTVNSGLTLAEEAAINGDLTYTQITDIEIPDGVVAGEITRNEPVVDEELVPAPPTPAEVAANWTLDLLRTIATLAIFGFLLIWLAPNFLKGLTEKLQSQPIPSFGWGVVAYAAFFFALLLIVVVMIVGGILFGIISLGGVTGTIIWVGILAIFALIVGFVLFTGFGSQILVAWLGGKWILSNVKPNWAEHKVWPMLLGVVIVGLLVNLPVVGWLVGFLIMFFGLGALWLWGREKMRKPAIAA